MSRSITQRLLISNLLVLTAFLGLGGAALDGAFRTSSEAALRDRLQAHLYTLLATADEDDRGRMRLPEAISTPAFNNPDSGIYAEVSGEQGNYRWRSRSLLGSDHSLAKTIPAGQSRFTLGDELALLEMGIGWEDNQGRAVPYAIGVAADMRALRNEQTAFRGTLWRWLGGLAALLLLVQVLLVRWGLSPLHAMSAAVRRIEAGESARIDGPVPRELDGLSANLNSLIQQNRTRQERVRNSLADLAHSMKTPLAVLRGAAEQGGDSTLRQLITEQTERIDQIVVYQRQRAAVAGVSSVTRPIEVAPILRRLCASLAKVHAERGLRCTIEVPDDMRLRADQADLYELFGNLLENAFKYARSQLVVSAEISGDALVFRIDDDGPGVAPGESERVLRRGERADNLHAGDGIGLAVADEIVAQYGGGLVIEHAPSGGASVRVTLPR